MLKCLVSFLGCVCLCFLSDLPAYSAEGRLDVECVADEGRDDVILASEMPCALGTISGGETKNYLVAIQSSRARHTITLQPLTGDADLKIWLTSDPRATPFAQSCQGPLQTDRVSLSPAVLTDKSTIAIQVVGKTKCRYLLFVTITPFHLALRPSSPTKSLKVTVEERFGDAEHIVADLAVCNRSGAWYEAMVTAGDGTNTRTPIPRSFILGPRQTRSYSCIAFGPTDSLTLVIDRTTQTALIYLACDIVARLVSGGTGLPATTADDVQFLIPQLEPLARVGALFTRGQVSLGTKRLVDIVKNDPKTFTALHQFLRRSGIRVTSSILTGKILSGFGAISAIVQGLTLLQTPERDALSVQVLPNTDAVQ